MDGKGLFVWPDGKKYEGSFTVKNIFVIYYIYKGDFYNDHFEGFGVFTWQNGTQYEG